MASSSDEFNSAIPAWRGDEVDVPVAARELAIKAFNQVDSAVSTRLPIREWWAETEALLRSGWSPGDVVTFTPRVEHATAGVAECASVGGTDMPGGGEVLVEITDSDGIRSYDSIDPTEPDDEVLAGSKLNGHNFDEAPESERIAMLDKLLEPAAEPAVDDDYEDALDHADPMVDDEDAGS